MPSFMLRHIPEGVIAKAKARALAAGTRLDAVLLAFLQSYAEKGSIQSQGGQARAAALTPDRRVAIAKAAIQARWEAVKAKAEDDR